MYDSTRPDVVAAYPTGRNYTNKMAIWAAAFKKEFPDAEVALLAMTWRPDNGPREAAWNDQVFNVPPELLENIDAATLHPYFGIPSLAEGERVSHPPTPLKTLNPRILLLFDVAGRSNHNADAAGERSQESAKSG